MKAITFHILIACFTICCCYTAAIAQHELEARGDVGRRMAAYNIGFGFVNGAVGVLLNEDKPRWKDVLIKGGLQGGAGGYLVHLGKNYAYKHSGSGKIKDYWISNALFSTGTSVIENASLGKWGYEKLTFDYLFARIQVDISGKRVGLGLNYSEMCANTVFLLKNHKLYKLDHRRTFQYGVFISEPIDPMTMKGVAGKNTFIGGIQMNTTRLDEGVYPKVLTHELLHYYQDRQYTIYSTWLNNYLRDRGTFLFRNLKGSNRNKIYLFAELLGPMAHDLVAYPLAGALSNSSDHYSNIFEAEARYYSRGH